LGTCASPRAFPSANTGWAAATGGGAFAFAFDEEAATDAPPAARLASAATAAPATAASSDAANDDGWTSAADGAVVVGPSELEAAFAASPVVTAPWPPSEADAVTVTVMPADSDPSATRTEPPSAATVAGAATEVAAAMSATATAGLDAAFAGVLTFASPAFATGGWQAMATVSDW